MQTATFHNHPQLKQEQEQPREERPQPQQHTSQALLPRPCSGLRHRIWARTGAWAIALVALMTTVSAEAAMVFQDSFEYPDGPLAAFQGSPWITQGGTAFQMNITGRRVELHERESEDLAAGLAPNPVNSGDLYFSFSLEVAELPRGDGNYFMHLKDAGSSQKARVWITTNAAPAGRCRLGVSNGTGTPQFLSNPIAAGEVHRVMIHYRVSTPTRTSIWLDPVTEASTVSRLVAEDNNTRLTTVYALAFRQALSAGDGMGRLWVDDLRIATTFEEALGPGSGPRLELVKEESGLVLTWASVDAMRVEVTQSLVNPVWERMGGIPELMGDQNRLRVPMGLGRAFYRLISP